MNEKILISGASIAGPTLAYWLARYGFRPTVVERAPGAAGGNGVDVRGQAIEVAERMGIMPQIRAAAADVIGMSFVDAADRRVARIDLQAIQRKKPAARSRSCVATWRRILYEANKRRRRVHFRRLHPGARAGRRRRDSHLRAGAPAAASTWSSVPTAYTPRSGSLVFGPESQFVRYLGHYGAFADADPALGEERWMTLYNEPGKVAGVYRSGNHAGAKANFMFRRREPLTYDYRDVEQRSAC